MAFPLLCSPVDWDTMKLVDGGISDNLPVEVAIQNNADLTIAVDATSPLRHASQMNSPWQIADQVTTILMKQPTQESRVEKKLARGIWRRCSAVKKRGLF